MRRGMLRALLRSGYPLRMSSMRLLSTAAPFSETPTKSISKEAMLKLRKRTGYSFVNCRKALVKFGEENLDEAEKYLKEMALKEGWEKAAKVGGRQTSQGQCGVASAANIAAVVELMCETDFVANSALFKKLVADLTNGLLTYAKQNMALIRTPTSQDDGSKVVDIDPKILRTASGILVEDAITAVIGRLGENISFKRAHIMASHADINVLGFTHPMEVVDDVGIGRFVSAIGIRKKGTGSGFPMDKLAYQLCQHIIGMNPESLGKPLLDSVKNPATFAEEHSDVREETMELLKDKQNQENDDINAFTDVQATSIDENEKQLLRQAFMLNPRQTVSDYLDTHGCEILDFWRVELGKNDEGKST